MKVVEASEVKAFEAKDLSLEAAAEIKAIFLAMGLKVNALSLKEGLNPNGIMCTLYYLMRDFLLKEGVDIVGFEKKMQEDT